MKKSQISIEFLFILSIVLFISLIIFGFIFDKRSELNDLKTYLDKRNECIKLSNLIKEAFVNGNGININSKINNDAFIYADSKLIYVDDTSCSLAISSVSDSISNNFLIKNGTINIQNKNGQVIVKNV